MPIEDAQIKQATEDLGEQIAPEVVQYMDALLQAIFQRGTIPKEALGFDDEQIEEIYGQAYRLYNTGKYKEAINLFRTLVVLDSTETKYCMGMAACFHMLKDYENAVKAYTIAGIIDGDDPVPHFHASDCYTEMKDDVSALICLEMAIKRAGEKPEYQVLKDRALLTLESVKKFCL